MSAKTTLTKNTLVLRYENGVDDKGNPKFTTQKFSRIKLTASDDSILQVGEALNSLIASDNTSVSKEEVSSLETAE